MPDYEPEKKELASRDVVSRRMEEHIAKGLGAQSRFGEHLWLDITQLGRTTSSTTCARCTRSASTSWASTRREGLDPGAPGAALHDGRRAHRRQRPEPHAEGPVRRRRGRLLGHARLQPPGRQLGGRNGGGRHDRRREHRRLLRPRRPHIPLGLVREFIAAARTGRPRPPAAGGGTEERHRAARGDAGAHDRQGGHLPPRRQAGAGGGRTAGSCCCAAATSACPARPSGANPELVAAYRTQKMLKVALWWPTARWCAPKAAARTTARPPPARRRHWLKRTLATWPNAADTLPTLAYEPLDVMKPWSCPRAGAATAPRTTSTTPTPRRAAEVAALRDRMAGADRHAGAGRADALRAPVAARACAAAMNASTSRATQAPSP
jgi:fumarate reductase flavoprotein subunit